ncbi:MAG: DUF2933 domain-containing protein [Polaromonas sp.]
MNHDHSQHDSEPKGFWGSRYSIGLVVMGAVAAYFLLSEHRAHLFGALPFVILLACPLMHVFMHHGHGRRHRGHVHHHVPEQGPMPTVTAPATSTGERP